MTSPTTTDLEKAGNNSAAGKEIPANTTSAWARWKEKHESTLRDIRLSIHLFSKSPLSILGLAIVGTFFIVALIGPLMVPFPEDATGTWTFTADVRRATVIDDGSDLREAPAKRSARVIRDVPQ